MQNFCHMSFKHTNNLISPLYRHVLCVCTSMTALKKCIHFRIVELHIKYNSVNVFFLLLFQMYSFMILMRRGFTPNQQIQNVKCRMSLVCRIERIMHERI